jgi:hypothetical protein
LQAGEWHAERVREILTCGLSPGARFATFCFCRSNLPQAVPVPTAGGQRSAGDRHLWSRFRGHVRASGASCGWAVTGAGGRQCPLAGDPIGREPALSPVFDKLDRASAPGDAIFGRRHLILQRIRQHRGLPLVRSGKWLCRVCPAFGRSLANTFSAMVTASG